MSDEKLPYTTPFVYDGTVGTIPFTCYLTLILYKHPLLILSPYLSFEMLKIYKHINV